MSLPELLAETAGDESVVATVPLGGDDRLAVTPTRTLVYRGDGLLSDESVATYSHDVERIALSTGRRKAKLTLGYGLDGDETIAVPVKRADEVLHPILAGVLSARGVTDPGESVVRTFRFSDLTLVVTSDRLVKHVGSAVWDEEFEEFPYADLTDLDFEEGTVATAVVLAHGGRSERFKAPNESARAVRETLVDAVCAFHDVDSLEEFRVTVAADEGGAGDATATTGGTTDFGEGPDPLSASPVADAEAEAEAGTEAGTGADAEADTAAEPEREPASAAAIESDSRAVNDVDRDGSGPEGADPSDRDDADPLSADIEDAAPPTSRDATTTVTDDTGPEGAASTGSMGATGEAETTALDTSDDDIIRGADASMAKATAVDTDADRDGDADHSVDESAAPTGDNSFDGSPFESAGVEGEDLATEVAALRSTVEAQSDRLDRQSMLIEQLIEELRRGR
jgi:hypothetical protein